MNTVNAPAMLFYKDELKLLRGRMSREAFYTAVGMAAEFVCTGKTPEIEDPLIGVAFDFLTAAEARSQSAYEKRVESAKKAANARWAKNSEGTDAGKDASHAEHDACHAQEHERIAQEEARNAYETETETEKETLSLTETETEIKTLSLNTPSHEGRESENKKTEQENDAPAGAPLTSVRGESERENNITGIRTLTSVRGESENNTETGKTLTSARIERENLNKPVEVFGGPLHFTEPDVKKLEEAFERFWEAYPKKTCKVHAKKEFMEAAKLADPERIIAGVNRQKGSAQWRQENGRFVPMPERWLREGRWDDGSPGTGFSGWPAGLEVIDLG